MQVGSMTEKKFIRQVLGRYATTAQANKQDDGVIIELPMLEWRTTGSRVVYSLDHPGQIDRPLAQVSSMRFYGRWVAACTLGDVIAMGAQPLGFSLDLSLPLEQHIEDVDEIMRGITDVLAKYKTEFEGGNLDRGPLGTVGFGWGITKSEPILRSGAHIGDLVVVTGPLGVGWASWLSRKRNLWNDLSAQSREYFAGYNEFPVAPIDAILECASAKLFTSGMDLPDGLLEFAYTINERMGHGVIIDQDRLTATTQVEEVASLLGMPSYTLLLEPGFDTPHSHGYTVAPGDLDQVKRVFNEHGEDLLVVGNVVARPGVWFRRPNGTLHPLPYFCDDQFVDDRIVGWEAMAVSIR